MECTPHEDLSESPHENTTGSPFHQKYYISIKAGKNIAFIKVRNKKVRLIAMMPEEEIRSSVKHNAVVTLSESVQDFYNGPGAAVDTHGLEHFDEISALIRTVVAYNKAGIT